MYNRKLLIGDIRGELGLLKELFDQVQPTEQDYLLFLGSYLGPGPDSKGVIDYLIDLKNKRPRGSTGFLWGCYESCFGAATAENAPLDVRHLWYSMQGDKVLGSYARQGNLIHLGLVDGKTTKVEMHYQVPMTHIDFIEHELRDWYQDHDYPFVASHGGFNPYNWQNPTRQEVTFSPCPDGRGWWESDWHLPGLDIVFSHIPHDQPFIGKGKIGIDLGAGLGGKLCALEYPSKQFHIVSPRKAIHVGSAATGDSALPV